MIFIGAFAGISGLYYLSRTNEINRIRNLKFSLDMMINVNVRMIGGALVGDFVGRKLFINYNKVNEHKVANHEVRKIMRQFPNARPYLGVH